METKKNPKFDLENYSKLFILLGLVLTLFCVHVAMEHKTYDKFIKSLGPSSLSSEQEEEMVVTERLQPIKPPPPPPPPPPPTLVEIVEDDKEIEEVVFEDTEDDDEPIEVDEIEEADEGEIVEDVPFAIIEDAPIFPGCKGNKQELRDCLQKGIQRHITRKFDSSLAEDLGLSPGKKRIFVSFKIDKNGNVVEVQARAPHPRLKREAEKAVISLPKMTPGKQRGRAVGVRYALPITFLVE